jgi:RNA polymerase sigma-70 factor (ECF subfamily)
MDAYPASEPTDEALMQRLAAGEEAALAALMARWELPLKRFLYRLLLDAHEAADLAQETCVKLYQRRETYRAGARFAPWILTIAANLARNRRRWWRRHPAVSLAKLAPDASEGTGGWEPADPAAGPSERAQRREAAAAVRAAVAALPHELREIVVLAEYEERPQAEIAEILGCTTKAVEMRLYRARERLRRALGPALGS